MPGDPGVPVDSACTRDSPLNRDRYAAMASRSRSAPAETTTGNRTAPGVVIHERPPEPTSDARTNRTRHGRASRQRHGRASRQRHGRADRHGPTAAWSGVPTAAWSGVPTAAEEDVGSRRSEPAQAGETGRWYWVTRAGPLWVVRDVRSLTTWQSARFSSPALTTEPSPCGRWLARWAARRGSWGGIGGVRSGR